MACPLHVNTCQPPVEWTIIYGQELNISTCARALSHTPNTIIWYFQRCSVAKCCPFRWTRSEKYHQRDTPHSNSEKQGGKGQQVLGRSNYSCGCERVSYVPFHACVRSAWRKLCSLFLTLCVCVCWLLAARRTDEDAAHLCIA